MDPGAIVGVVAVVVTGAWLLWTRAIEAGLGHRRRQIADELGLTQCAMHEATLVGRHGGLSVCLRPLGGTRNGTHVSVEGLASGVGLRSQIAMKPTLGSELQVGDHMFDAEVTVSGSPLLLRALLDAPTRSLARDVFAQPGPVVVQFGVLTAEIEESFAGRWRLNAALVRPLLALGERLQQPAAVEARLAIVAQSDPLAAVRRGALDTLIARSGKLPATRTALVEATRDRDPELRLAAATALGPAGNATLQALAADGSVDDAVSAGAIVALGGHLTFERARPILDAAVTAGRTRTACEALRVMGRGNDAEARVIAQVLARSEGDVALAAVQALGDTLAPAAERPLLDALAMANPIAIVAAGGLARLGSVGAVADLRQLERRGGEAGHAARQAIAVIQSRLTGATPGQVALADGDAGRVALADDAAGRVSPAKDDA